MSSSSRKWRILAAVLVVATAWANQAAAQGFPTKPLRLVVPYPPGGPSDTTARAVAGGMAAALGQPVVVENKPGAGAIVGSEAVLAAPHDGYTLLMGSNVLTTGKWLYPKMSFDAMRDFRAVAGVFRSPHIVVAAPTFAATNIQDLIRMAKAQPGKLDYASSGGGTMPHLGAELFKQATGTSITGIPYKGSGPALTAVMAGEVPVYFDIQFSAQSLLMAGKLKALGVTGKERSPQFPKVPTLIEQGLKDFELYSWFGIVVPSDVPDAVVERLNAAVNQAMAATSFKEQLDRLGAFPMGGSPQSFKAMMEKEAALWGPTIKRAGITLE
ncbi:tripartite tricarboxylate transporter substrate binding protein [Variovorax sp. J22R115]|uniref:Bug family tripartite tricarboxylate transporter substrate binding protein n=1 Tax=Variovorax sp. J22R115 TaxID=3053509 RepID=UPI00257843F3|nr:tripartite tricarboxylate transporter substrate binding protein [Variovorax sp. J22R115]MDM0048824.1 tripartite tricarboxylate transporter substrate binding protein [Variovorax sp. J22R115]